MNVTPTDRREPALAPGSAAAALIAGTVTGSALLALVVIVSALVAGLTQGGLDAALGSGMLLALMFFLFSLPVWAAGLAAVGIPGWTALHALGWRSRRTGAAFGGVATFITALILSLSLGIQNTDGAWGPLLAASGVLALIGAIVGWVVTATAYGEKEAAR